MKTMSVNFSHALFSLLSTHDDLVMQALVFALRGPVQNNLAYHGPIHCFICIIKMTSYIEAPNLRKKPRLAFK